MCSDGTLSGVIPFCEFNYSEKKQQKKTMTIFIFVPLQHILTLYFCTIVLISLLSVKLSTCYIYQQADKDFTG